MKCLRLRPSSWHTQTTASCMIQLALDFIELVELIT
jgi:hypothetical protein